MPWLTPRIFLTLSGGVAFCLGAVAQWWTGWFVLTLSCAGLGALAPMIWVQTAQERREVAIEGAQGRRHGSGRPFIDRLRFHAIG